MQHAGDDAVERLIELGALDVDGAAGAAIAALMPDSIAPEDVARALGDIQVSVSPAIGHDADSVWMLRRPPIRIGPLHIVAAEGDVPSGALALIDAPAFGTGHHPTTALCLEALVEIVQDQPPARLLDVGTGSGILALAGLRLGVPRAVAIDLDPDAVRVAAENARRNDLRDRLHLIGGGVDALTGTWPLIVANVLAAPLIDLAPRLVRLLGSRGRVVLSGIPVSVEADVRQAYVRLGLRSARATSRGGWVALDLQASWGT